MADASASVCGNAARRTRSAYSEIRSAGGSDGDFGSVLGDFEGLREDQFSFTAEERKYLDAMHYARTSEMLRCRSTKFFHKFSVACPAHIVATALCVWFLITFSILSLFSLKSSVEISELMSRMHAAELAIAHRKASG